MCIALLSSSHPDYALILVNNRDEYLNRPTAAAHWWEAPNENVLGARDLLRKEQGTWLGITKQGRVAVLTNFREDGVVQGARSRGAMVNAFLTQFAHQGATTEQFIETLTEGEGLKGVGGFSLICGKVGDPLAVISNRTPDVASTPWIFKDSGETIGLSNAAFANRSWPKVLSGEELLSQAIKDSVSHHGSKASLIENLFELLSVDTLPKKAKGMGWETYVKELRKSIFIPVIGGAGTDELSADDLAAAKSEQQVLVGDDQENRDKGDGLSGLYGTEKQSVVLVDHRGHVTFVERSLYGSNGKVVPASERDRVYEFDVEGWQVSGTGDVN